MLRFVSGLLLAGLLAACSSLPDVEYSYYPSKSSTTATVTQTIDCNSAKTAFIIVNTPSVTTAYAADLDKPPYRIRIKDIEGGFGPFADSDANFTFYDDGRLKSINQNTQGQGETIIKSAVSLGTAIAALGGGGPATGNKDDKPPLADECDAITKWGGGKPVSLTYTGVIDLGQYLQQTRGLSGVRPILIPPASGSVDLYTLLNAKGKLAPPGMMIGKPTDGGNRARAIPQSEGEVVNLTLQQMSNVKVDVTYRGQIIGSTNVTVPSSGAYSLPIPRAALFGKQSFALSLTEAGAITNVDYGKNTGAAGALNAANTIVTAVTPEAASAKAADVKGQADLMAQQARLLRCQTNPSSCS